ncbi:MAG: DUF2723 domain-containing protein [Bacteroidales bacterium]|nr:DUF2723 domain-containing protein [Bacteroidales bacterium]
MDKKQFNLISRIVGLAVFVVATLTYVLTLEPTTSFWDCGEFIASSYKLEVGHPPGNPVFQLVARFFTMFASAENAAYAVNFMNAICSSLTILFLYLTIMHLGRRLLEKNGREYLSVSNAIALWGSAAVGALAYCWSDTFWFSAVEGEVYAMSSLLTAIVFWAMLKWEDEADEPYANRWIVLIAFLLGLSIGVHLLNLLAIPAIAFIYYYKKSTSFTWGKAFGVLALSAVILAVILWGIIPYLPKLAAYVDLLFVNGFGLPYNTGAVVFMLLLLAACFWLIYFSHKRGKVLLNTITLCFTMIVIGYSSFAVVVIRSSVNTPTNEYQPDNPFTLVRYLGREQYGSNPLVYGETFASVPTNYSVPKYYTPLDGKYYKTDGPLDVKYPAESKMLFPRMWSKSPDHIEFYKHYTGDGKVPQGGSHKMPTFKENLSFFFDYQINWMYFRYFFWNFVGRQNDLHSPSPGEPLKGNWESGIGFIDKARLGDQSVGPDYIVDSRSKNHYYFLPLILGLIGLFFQLKKDQQNWWVTMLLFLLTGIGIVVYLNQPPLQVRERDYAYAGSFYMFCVWIGLAVMAIHQFIEQYIKGDKLPKWLIPSAVSVLALIVPIQMASQNWDDHDRSGRYTAQNLAYNYLMSLDENAIIVTHGDNDTFPLWYIQEVEGVRLDTRIMNTSLLGTDWYIDQMRRKIYDSDPVKFSLDRIDYLYGKNEFPDVVDRVNRPITLKEAITLFKDPRVKINRYGTPESFIAQHKLRLPVNKENVKKYGIVAEEDYDKIVDTLYMDIPAHRSSISKTELMILDMLSNYDWDRPIYFVSQGGDLDIGLRNYLQFEGFAYKFVPIKSTTRTADIGQIDALKMFDKVMKVYEWDNLADTTINIDYQNLATFNGVMNIRGIFVQTAVGLFEDGYKEKAVQVLDRMQQVMVPQNFPLNTSILYSINEYMVLQAIEVYIKCGEKEKGVKLAQDFARETLESVELFAQPYGRGIMSKSDLENNYSLYGYMLEILSESGCPEEAKALELTFNETITAILAD